MNLGLVFFSLLVSDTKSLGSGALSEIQVCVYISIVWFAVVIHLTRFGCHVGWCLRSRGTPEMPYNPRWKLHFPSQNFSSYSRWADRMWKQLLRLDRFITFAAGTKKFMRLMQIESTKLSTKESIIMPHYRHCFRDFGKLFISLGYRTSLVET